MDNQSHELENWVPDITDVNAFLLVARSGGFRQAARESGISSSALSDAVRRLEEDLGVRLFNRTTRSVLPTEPDVSCWSAPDLPLQRWHRHSTR